VNIENQCPRCGASPLKNWQELDEDEREVVRRLPGSADYSSVEREKTHRWCARCWYEEKNHLALDT